MSLQINTNVAALNAHRNLSNTQNSLSSSLEKLSSGLRINRAADDAAYSRSPRVCAVRSTACRSLLVTLRTVCLSSRRPRVP